MKSQSLLVGRWKVRRVLAEEVFHSSGNMISPECKEFNALNFVHFFIFTDGTTGTISPRTAVFAVWLGLGEPQSVSKRDVFIGHVDRV